MKCGVRNAKGVGRTAKCGIWNLGGRGIWVAVESGWPMMKAKVGANGSGQLNAPWEWLRRNRYDSYSR